MLQGFLIINQNGAWGNFFQKKMTFFELFILPLHVESVLTELYDYQLNLNTL